MSATSILDDRELLSNIEVKIHADSTDYFIKNDYHLDILRRRGIGDEAMKNEIFQDTRIVKYPYLSIKLFGPILKITAKGGTVTYSLVMPEEQKVV